MTLFMIVALLILANGPQFSRSTHVYQTEEACRMDAAEVFAGYMMDPAIENAYVDCITMPGDDA